MIITDFSDVSRFVAAIVAVMYVFNFGPVGKYLLNKILGMIKVLVVIIHFTTLHVNQTRSMQVFFASFLPLVTFDFLPEEWFHKLFHLHDL